MVSRILGALLFLVVLASVVVFAKMAMRIQSLEERVLQVANENTDLKGKIEGMTTEKSTQKVKEGVEFDETRYVLNGTELGLTGGAIVTSSREACIKWKRMALGGDVTSKIAFLDAGKGDDRMLVHNGTEVRLYSGQEGGTICKVFIPDASGLKFQVGWVLVGELIRLD